MVADVVTLERHPEWKKHVLEGRHRKTPQPASTSDDQNGNGGAQEVQGSNNGAIAGRSEIPVQSDPLKALEE